MSSSLSRSLSLSLRLACPLPAVSELPLICGQSALVAAAAARAQGPLELQMIDDDDDSAPVELVLLRAQDTPIERRWRAH